MERPTTGETIAAVAGALLLVGLTLDWFAVDVTAARIRGAEALADQAGSSNAWEAFGVRDILLLVVAVVALVPAGARLTGGPAELMFHPGIAVAAAGAFGMVVAIIGIAEPPIEEGRFAGGIGVDVGIELGGWLSVAACAGILAGGALWSRSGDY